MNEDVTIGTEVNAVFLADSTMRKSSSIEQNVEAVKLYQESIETETRREERGVPPLIEEGTTLVARAEVVSPTSTILHKIETPMIDIERQRHTNKTGNAKGNDPQSTTRSQNLVKSPHADTIEIEERKNAS